jgi:hypothetical protein
MRFAEYVIAGWALTAGVVTGYWAILIRRTKRAERSDI